MRVQFTVQGLPPKKDGANSMWRKPSEVPRLKALRSMAVQAMQGVVWQSRPLRLRLRICAAIGEGDLDNFITGVCDGLMGAHKLTPILLNEWQDMPEDARPHHVIAFEDDRWIMQIVAERILPEGRERFYEVELESLAK